IWQWYRKSCRFLTKTIRRKINGSRALAPGRRKLTGSWWYPPGSNWLDEKPTLLVLVSEIEEVREHREVLLDYFHEDNEGKWRPRKLAVEIYCPYVTEKVLRNYRNKFCPQIGKILRSKVIPLPAGWLGRWNTIHVYHDDDLQLFGPVRKTPLNPPQ